MCTKQFVNASFVPARVLSHHAMTMLPLSQAVIRSRTPHAAVAMFDPVDGKRWFRCVSMEDAHDWEGVLQ